MIKSVKRLEKGLGTLGLVAGLILEVFLKLQLTTWCLLFHLVYYNIAYRVSSLKLLIDQPIKFGYKASLIVGNRKLPLSQRLEKIGYLLDRLAKVSNKLRYIFCFPALLIITISFLDFTICMFFTIQNFLYEATVSGNLYLQMTMVMGNLVLALTVIFATDMVTSEVVLLLHL